ncbi:hypothetical protein EON65_15775 [archaeon]|nr:MAG: hypothetical protein EON65_15775 [archaeon]
MLFFNALILIVYFCYQDERFILPDDAWDLINPEAAIEGVEISDMIRESSKSLCLIFFVCVCISARFIFT